MDEHACPEKPSDLGIETGDGKDQWREGQRDTINLIIRAFRTKRFVLASMPTGSGKTIVATAVQRIMGWSSVNLTHTIQLQKQYAETLPWAQVVTGRRNHYCELTEEGQPTIYADTAICSVGDSCDYIRPDGCSYYKMLFGAADNPQAVINYAYATRILQLPRMKRMKTEGNPDGKNPFHRELLVCDEGDLAEGAIVQAARISLTPQRWVDWELEFAPPSLEKTKWDDYKTYKDLTMEYKVIAWKEWARDTYSNIEDYANVAADTFRVDPSDANRKERGRLQGMVSTLDAIMSIGNPKEWVIEEDGNKIHIRPLWAYSVAERMLFKPFQHILIMSGTLHPIVMDMLGIDKEEAEYIDVKSTFPTENRPVFYWPVIRLNRHAGEAEWDRLASAIEFLATNGKLKEQKGIVHTGSHKIAAELYDRLRWSLPNRNITNARGVPGAMETEEALRYFRDAEQPLILITPSVATGVDLPYLIGWQVIAKVPYGNLGDPITKARFDFELREGDKFGRKVYDMEAMSTVIQAAGRAVRAPDDRGVTYILDGNYWQLHKRTVHPSHYDSAFLWMNSGQKRSG